MYLSAKSGSDVQLKRCTYASGKPAYAFSSLALQPIPGGKALKEIQIKRFSKSNDLDKKLPAEQGEKVFLRSLKL